VRTQVHSKPGSLPETNISYSEGRGIVRVVRGDGGRKYREGVALKGINRGFTLGKNFATKERRLIKNI